jgi:hypothetical protein
MSKVMDELRSRIAKAVENPGWFVVGVLPAANTPSFSYTVGLTETARHPEVLMLGFDNQLMHRLLNTAGQHIKDGRQFDDWDSSDQVVAAFPVVFRTVPFPEARQWARVASERYRTRGGFKLLQMFVPDAHGHFPWEVEADPDMAPQARLLPLMVSRLI